MKKTNQIHLHARLAARPAAGLCTALLGLSSAALAAGGHHAVDDAAILDPGQCQLETWVDRDAAQGRGLLHLGPACRVGAVELGLNLDRSSGAGASSGTALGPQIKWAHAVTEQLSVGLLGAASWDSRPRQASRYLGSSLVVPLSLQLSEQWAAHLNLGRDFRAGRADSSRAGAALEWAPQQAWSLIAERFREGGLNAGRLGGRWQLSRALSLDLSRASGLGTHPPSWWTLGLNLVVDR